MQHLCRLCVEKVSAYCDDVTDRCGKGKRDERRVCSAEYCEVK